jgi:geranylgeranyl diphosphate synthase type II
MRYGVFPGGKRIRPVLMLAVCEALGGDINVCLPFACAVELIHSSSLIHDDLPALDDDDTRRGKPSCHVACGEGMAVFAGDALLNLAYEIMAGECAIKLLPALAHAMSELSAAAGAEGMLGGQAADLLNENRTADEEAILFIEKNKTGRLIGASMSAGAIIAEAEAGTVELMYETGLRLGLAFQILDDILDVEGDADKLGKPLNSDEKNNKSTYIAIGGIQKARDDYNTIMNAAKSALGEFGRNNGSFLPRFIDYIEKRDS